jgi:hypothetical protein
MYGLLVALVVLIALAALLDANLLEPAAPETGSVTPTLEPLWTVDVISINLIRIQDLKKGTHVEVQKDLKGTWLVMDLPAVEADTSAVETAVTNLAKLVITRDYGEGLNPEEFGLEEDSYLLLTVKTSDGQTFELEIGALTPTGTGYYVRMKDNPERIYGVKNTTLSGIIGWLTSKPIPATITPTFTITPTDTLTPTVTPTVTETPTVTDTPTVMPTASETVPETPGTPVPTLSPTPTP